MAHKVFSIDQNCTALWDARPKVESLVRAGLDVTHFVEDVDVAFTRRGATEHSGVDSIGIEREACYPDGGSDWGAALFYQNFLGRNPIDLSILEKYVGLTPAAVSRRLGMSVAELCAIYSVSDTLQLVGLSRAGGGEHRTIGDVWSREVEPHLMELLHVAHFDCLQSFPSPDSRVRIDAWFDKEERAARTLLAEAPSLADFHHASMDGGVNGLKVSRTSDLFRLSSGSSSVRLLTLFCRDHAVLCALYNESVAEHGVGVRKLRVEQGELPFFAVSGVAGRMLRAPLSLQDGHLCAGQRKWKLAHDKSIPLDDIGRDGVVAIVGKALLLVLDVRMPPYGAALALPHKGSSYMPAAIAFERKLTDAGLLWAVPAPVLRVKFNFQSRWAPFKTPICPPPHIRRRLGLDILSSADLSEAIIQLERDAEMELSGCESPDGRDRLRALLAPALFEKRNALETRRRVLAGNASTQPDASALFSEITLIDNQILRLIVERVVDDIHLAGLEYWNSRGAILPWAAAIGGQELLNATLDGSSLVWEPSPKSAI